MKNVTCRDCGDMRPAVIAPEGCKCSCEEIVINMNAVTDLVNSRDKAKLECTSCGNDLFGLDVDAYLHENGWRVPGIRYTWWLSIECPKCYHETSFTHFGIAK